MKVRNKKYLIKHIQILINIAKNYLIIVLLKLLKIVLSKFNITINKIIYKK